MAVGKPAVKDLVADCYANVRGADKLIKQICQKHYDEFVVVFESMNEFRKGLDQVKAKVNDGIAEPLKNVKTEFYQKAEEMQKE
jgi:ketosteroid isomerase-like protein